LFGKNTPEDQQFLEELATDFSPNNMTYLQGYTRENQPSTAIIMNIG
jgi:hypothetical protein